MDALKQWRLQEARRRRIPAFRILTDKVLTALVQERPRNEEELLGIHGIGPKIAPMGRSRLRCAAAEASLDASLVYGRKVNDHGTRMEFWRGTGSRSHLVETLPAWAQRARLIGMMVTGFKKRIFRPDCNPSFESLHCIAQLDEDVSDALPYLNAALGGHSFTREPPSVSFKLHGKLLTVHATEIAVNALKDEEEADRVLAWIVQQINEAWEKRNEIEPCFEGTKRPSAIELLRLLPRTNCGECGLPTCMLFALQLAEGGREPGGCPPITAESRAALQQLMEPFQAGW